MNEQCKFYKVILYLHTPISKQYEQQVYLHHTHRVIVLTGVLFSVSVLLFTFHLNCVLSTLLFSRSVATAVCSCSTSDPQPESHFVLSPQTSHQLQRVAAARCLLRILIQWKMKRNLCRDHKTRERVSVYIDLRPSYQGVSYPGQLHVRQRVCMDAVSTLVSVQRHVSAVHPG